MDRPLENERIDELDGVRAVLALWVLVYHVLGIGGFTVPNALAGKHAVSVFFALSGFVISLLLHRSRESYLPFIARRFFRLYPVYAIAIAVSTVLVELDVTPRIVDEASTWLHVLLHALMAHGLPPETLVPRASNALLNPAWSIAVEWQFYLVVPLFFAAYARRPFVALVGLFVAALIVRRLALPLRFGGGSLFWHANYFTYGIIGYFAYDWVKSHANAIRPFSAVLPIALPLLFSVLLPLGDSIGMLAWLSVLGIVLDAQARRDSKGSPLSPLVALLRSRGLVAIGAASYALYLIHEPVIWLTLHAVHVLSPGASRGVVTTVLAFVTLPASLALSLWMHRHIELPCMRFGRRILRPERAIRPVELAGA